MECQRRKVTSIPVPRSKPVSVPITIVRTFTQQRLVTREFRPDLFFARAQCSLKVLAVNSYIARECDSFLSDFSRLHRYTRDRREKETDKNASKRAHEGLEEIRSSRRLRASPSFRGSSRHFRRSLLSCFRSHARFLHSFFPPPFRTAIFLSSGDRLHTPRVGSRARNERGCEKTSRR